MSALEEGITRTLEGGCPEALAPVIREFVDSVCAAFPDQKIGVLLVGSASRGELSWRMDRGNTELFSDIEFLIGVERHDRAAQSRLDDRAKKISDDAKLGTFFHIDYTFIEWAKLGQLDTKFFIFESKTCGIDMCAHKLAPELPATSKANLNWKELNEILIHRLSAILHAIPTDFFAAQPSAQTHQQFALALAKNTLDITTWLHPYESTELTAGFRNRVASWQKTDFNSLKLSGFFGAADIQYLASCIALRGDPTMSADAREMLPQTMRLYRQAIRYCKHMNGIAEHESLSGFNSSRALFDEYRLRARLAQSASVLKHTRSVGLSRLWRNLFGVRRGLAVEICSNLIDAALAWKINEQHAHGELARAQDHLSKVIDMTISDQSPLPSRWYETRAVFLQHQQITRNY